MLDLLVEGHKCNIEPNSTYDSKMLYVPWRHMLHNQPKKYFKFLSPIQLPKKLQWLHEMNCILIESLDTITALRAMWCLRWSYDVTSITISLPEEGWWVCFGVGIHHAQLRFLIIGGGMIEIDNSITFIKHILIVPGYDSWFSCDSKDEGIIMQHHKRDVVVTNIRIGIMKYHQLEVY